MDWHPYNPKRWIPHRLPSHNPVRQTKTGLQWKRVNPRILWVGGGTLFLFIYFLIGGDGIVSSWKLRQQVITLQTRIDSLQHHNELLRQRSEAIKREDPQVLEREARAMGMIFPAEKVYVVMTQAGREP